MDDKIKRGGIRNGSGRKKKGDSILNTSISFRVSEEEKIIIKDYLKKEKKEIRKIILHIIKKG